MQGWYSTLPVCKDVMDFALSNRQLFGPQDSCKSPLPTIDSQPKRGTTSATVTLALYCPECTGKMYVTVT